jgi:molybdopterin converting factor small subunit
LFARARDLAGQGTVEVLLPEQPTVADLRSALSAAYPALQPLMPRMHVAINNEYASDSDAVPEGSQVACFPPVSGG